MEDNSTDKNMVTEKGEQGRFGVGVQNDLLRQISTYRLYVNLALLAGWVSVVASRGPIMNLLIPIGSVIALLLSMVSLHAAFDFIKTGSDIKVGTGAWYKMLELNSNAAANLLTVLVLVGFLVNMYFVTAK